MQQYFHEKTFYVVDSRFDSRFESTNEMNLSTRYGLRFKFVELHKKYSLTQFRYEMKVINLVLLIIDTYLFLLVVYQIVINIW